MKQYTVLTKDGFRVGVTEGGEGIPLVFLHGFSVSASAYTEMLELLAANGFHVFAFDAPDHGVSDSLPWGHTVKDMVRVIAEAIDQIEPLVWWTHHAPVVVGHSMGGWLAAEYAAMFPDWVSTLILLDAAVGTEFHRGTKLERKPSTVRRAAQFALGGLKDVFGDARKAGSARTLVERLRLMDILRGSVSGAGCLRAAYAMTQGDSTDALHALRGSVRTVVIHGSEDGIVPWQAGLSAAQAAGGRIMVLGGLYHSWMIADPGWALKQIRDALLPPDPYLTDNEDDAA